eukprot:3574843-Prymnesium_polylepis.1
MHHSTPDGKVRPCLNNEETRSGCMFCSIRIWSVSTYGAVLSCRPSAEMTRVMEALATDFVRSRSLCPMPPTGPTAPGRPSAP